MMAWYTELPTLAALLLLVVPSFVSSAPLVEQNTEMDSYYPVADSTGCYYNFQHYDEGDRIITNEPCLNCTCHNRMLMCYLRVCPFIKAIGENCKVEKRADQCCPVITCPEVPVQLLTSTTTESSGASSEVGHLDTYGCSIDKLFYSDGARVPSDPSKPCELCYCIRNKTACVMQECTLHIEGCTPVYQEGVCCPVRYDCEHPEDTLQETTAIPTTTTTLRTVFTTLPTVTPSDCIYEGEIYADGALIKKDLCDHCYCMKGDIVCAVQECGPTPLDKVNCTALPVKEGQCCPDSYDCENISEEELTTTYYELTTQASIKPIELEQTIINEIVTPQPEIPETPSPLEAGRPTEAELEGSSPSHKNQNPEILEERKPIQHPGEAITSAQQTTESAEENQTEIMTEIATEAKVPDEELPKEHETSEAEDNALYITEQNTLSNEVQPNEEHELVQESITQEPATTLKSVQEGESDEVNKEPIVPITETVVPSKPSHDCGDDMNCILSHTLEKEINTETDEGEPQTTEENIVKFEQIPEQSNEILPESAISEIHTAATPETTESVLLRGTEQPQVQPEVVTDAEKASIAETVVAETEEPEFMQRTRVPQTEAKVSPTTLSPQEEENKLSEPTTSQISQEFDNAGTEKEHEINEDVLITEPATIKYNIEVTTETLHGQSSEQNGESLVTEVEKGHTEVPVIRPVGEDSSSVPEQQPENPVEVEDQHSTEVVIHGEELITEQELSNIPTATEIHKQTAEEATDVDHSVFEVSTGSPTDDSTGILTEKSKPESEIQPGSENENNEILNHHETSEKPAFSETTVPHEKEPELPVGSDDIENENEEDHEEEHTAHEEEPIIHEEEHTLHEDEPTIHEEEHTVHEGEPIVHEEETVVHRQETPVVEEGTSERPIEKQPLIPTREEDSGEQSKSPVIDKEQEEIEAITEIIPSKAPDAPESQIKEHDTNATPPEDVILGQVPQTPQVINSEVSEQEPNKNAPPTESVSSEATSEEEQGENVTEQELNTEISVEQSSHAPKEDHAPEVEIEQSETSTAGKETLVETHEEIPTHEQEETKISGEPSEVPESSAETSESSSESLQSDIKTTEIPKEKPEETESPEQPDSSDEISGEIPLEESPHAAVTESAPPTHELPTQTEQSPTSHVEESSTDSVESPKLSVDIQKPPVEIPEPSISTPEAAVEKTESPVDITEAPIKVPITTEETSKSPNQIPQKPVENPESVVEASESPIEITESHVKTPELPLDTSELPLETSETPMAPPGSPADVSELPNHTPETPVEISESSVDVTKSTVETTKTPLELPESVKTPESEVETSESPVDIPESPIETLESQTSKLPTEVPDLPAEIPTKVPELPLETPESPMEVPEPPVKTSESPMEIPELPAQLPESPNETSESPVETPESPVQVPESPVETPEPPVELSESPVKTAEPSIETPGSPIETSESPVEASESPIQASESPLETSESSVENQESPLKSSEPSVETPESPTEESSIATSQSPVETSISLEKVPESPVKTLELPLETPQPPVEVPESPVESPESPVQVSESPTQTQESPVDVPESPMETSESPVETPELPVEVSESSVETSESPVEVPEMPVKTVESPVETSESPVNTPESPVEIPESTVKTAESPVETSESPVENPELPVKAQESPVKTLELPVETPKPPVEIPESPKEPSESPVEAPESPIEAPEVPTESSGETIKYPDEIPAETPESLVEASKIPETTKIQAETSEISEQNPTSSGKASESTESELLLGSSESPVETARPIETAELSTQTPQSPAQTAKLPDETLESLTEISKSPQISESSTEAPTLPAETSELPELPVKISETEEEISQLPTEVVQIPTEQPSAEIETEESVSQSEPESIQKTPTEIPDTLTELSQSPTEIPTSPVEIPEPAVESDKVETPETFTSSESPAELPKETAENVKPSIETTESPKEDTKEITESEIAAETEKAGEKDLIPPKVPEKPEMPAQTESSIVTSEVITDVSELSDEITKSPVETLQTIAATVEPETELDTSGTLTELSESQKENAKPQIETSEQPSESVQLVQEQEPTEHTPVEKITNIPENNLFQTTEPEHMEIITDIPQPTGKPIQSFDHVTEAAPNILKSEGQEIPVIVPEVQLCPPGAICEEPQPSQPIDGSNIPCETSGNCETSQEIPTNEEQPASSECKPGEKCVTQQKDTTIPKTCVDGIDCLKTETENEENIQLVPTEVPASEITKGQPPEEEVPHITEDHTLKQAIEESEFVESVTTQTHIPATELAPTTSKSDQSEAITQSKISETNVDDISGTTESKLHAEPTTQKILVTHESDESAITESQPSETERLPEDKVPTPQTSTTETEMSSVDEKSQHPTEPPVEPIPTEQEHLLPTESSVQDLEVTSEIELTRKENEKPTDSNEIIPQTVETESSIHKTEQSEVEGTGAPQEHPLVTEDETVSNEPTKDVATECTEEKCVAHHLQPVDEHKKPPPEGDELLNEVVPGDSETNVIPGEGSCLVDGQTYENNSSVPPINRCQIYCKCVSSILQCETVSCSAAPSNLENCMPIYHSPDSCCPTYSCTMPGQSTIESDSHVIETTTNVVIPEVTEANVSQSAITNEVPLGSHLIDTQTTEEPHYEDLTEQVPTKEKPSVVEEQTPLIVTKPQQPELNEPVPTASEESPAQTQDEKESLPHEEQTYHTPTEEQTEHTPTETDTAYIPTEGEILHEPAGEEEEEAHEDGSGDEHEKATKHELLETPLSTAHTPTISEEGETKISVTKFEESEQEKPESSKEGARPSESFLTQAYTTESVITETVKAIIEEEPKVKPSAFTTETSINQEDTTVPLQIYPEVQEHFTEEIEATRKQESVTEEDLVKEETPVVTTSPLEEAFPSITEVPESRPETSDKEAGTEQGETEASTEVVDTDEEVSIQTEIHISPTVVSSSQSNESSESSESVESTESSESTAEETELGGSQTLQPSDTKAPTEESVLEVSTNETPKPATEQETAQLPETKPIEGEIAESTTLHGKITETEALVTESPTLDLEQKPHEILENENPSSVPAEESPKPEMQQAGEVKQPANTESTLIETQTIKTLPEVTEGVIDAEIHTEILETEKQSPDAHVTESNQSDVEHPEVTSQSALEANIPEEVVTAEITSVEKNYEQVGPTEEPHQQEPAVSEETTEGVREPGKPETPSEPAFIEEPNKIQTEETKMEEPTTTKGFASEEESSKRPELSEAPVETVQTEEPSKISQSHEESPQTEETLQEPQGSQTEGPSEVQQSHNEAVQSGQTLNQPESPPESVTEATATVETASEKITEKVEPVTSETLPEVTKSPVQAVTSSIHDLYTSPPHPEKTTPKSIIPGQLHTSAPIVPNDLQPLLTTLAPHYHVTSTTFAPNYEKARPTKLPVPEHIPEQVPDSEYAHPTEEDYDEEEPGAFGPGTCRYGGKVYVSAQQIPRDDPCDFCFCFRSDIICLQQSCPPPIPRCHEEPIRGFCCPRYECPVNMATSVNITTTSTTTTTTLPPHFLAHAYRGKATRNGCLIQGQAYKVGEVIRSASGPCLHCVCGGDGQMQCDPKVCSPEPMLRQMIEATVSSRR